MYIFLMIIVIIVCVFLGLNVLIQNPKGGGLTSSFSSSSQLMGVKKTGDFLEKGTWILAISLMVLAMAINVAVKGGSSSGSQYDEQIQKSLKAPVAAPSAFPTTPAAPPLQLPAKK